MTDPITTTIDLEDRLETVTADLEEAREERDAIRARAAKLGPPETWDETESETGSTTEAKTDKRATWAELETTFSEQTERVAQIERTRDVLRSRLQAWSDGTFEIKQLTWGEKKRVDDLVRAQAIQDGTDDARAKLGAYEVALANVATVRVPDGAPGDAERLPPAIGEWLVERVQAFNDRGATEDEAGNSSLRSALQASTAAERPS
jgi:hypothetical protein